MSDNRVIELGIEIGRKGGKQTNRGLKDKVDRKFLMDSKLKKN